jgi:hypothetical protein
VKTKTNIHVIDLLDKKSVKYHKAFSLDLNSLLRFELKNNDFEEAYLLRFNNILQEDETRYNKLLLFCSNKKELSAGLIRDIDYANPIKYLIFVDKVADGISHFILLTCVKMASGYLRKADITIKFTSKDGMLNEKTYLMNHIPQCQPVLNFPNKTIRLVLDFQKIAHQLTRFYIEVQLESIFKILEITAFNTEAAHNIAHFIYGDTPNYKLIEARRIN